MTYISKSTTVSTELSTIFESPPSFEDFCNAIKAKPHNKAEGLTGTTYTMVKCWSPAMNQLVYDNIIPSLGTRQTPWKISHSSRWLPSQTRLRYCFSTTANNL